MQKEGLWRQFGELPTTQSQLPTAPGFVHPRSLQHRWLSIAYMARAQLGDPFPRGREMDGWAWAGPPSEAVEANALAALVANALLRFEQEPDSAGNAPAPGASMEGVTGIADDDGPPPQPYELRARLAATPEGEKAWREAQERQAQDLAEVRVDGLKSIGLRDVRTCRHDCC